MLVTVDTIRAVPQMNNLAAVPTAFLNQIVGAVDRTIKKYLKRDIELQAYEEFYSGDTTRDVVCRQYPVLAAQTTVAGGSDGVALPTSEIFVASIAGFNPGTGGNPNAVAPSLTVQCGPSTWTRVTYTGTNTDTTTGVTSFTGCQGGKGTLSLGNRITSPTVWYDPSGYFGTAPNGFNDQTLMVYGTQFVPWLDGGEGAAGRKSGRGLLRRIGGAGQGFVGFYPETMYSGKLGAYRQPTWPRGDGNIKVAYCAGFGWWELPLDLVNAAAQLAAYMVRNMPKGGPLSSESLGAYSYSMLTMPSASEGPEVGSIRQTLASYRESAWGL